MNPSMKKEAIDRLFRPFSNCYISDGGLDFGNQCCKVRSIEADCRSCPNFLPLKDIAKDRLVWLFSLEECNHVQQLAKKLWGNRVCHDSKHRSGEIEY